MELKAVQDEVLAIAMVARDDEAAHSKEDNLWEGVLRAIASGAPNAQELADAALQTKKIEFARWCA